VDEGEVVLELDLWNVRERVWDPGWGSSRQTGRITSTKTSSKHGHDRRSEGADAAFSVSRIGHVSLHPPCSPIPSLYTISLNEPWSTVQSLPAFWIQSLDPGRLLAYSPVFPRSSPACPSSLHFPRLFHPRLSRYPVLCSCAGTQVRSGQSQGEGSAQDIFHSDVRPAPDIFVSLS